jgi:glycosyltransferase involved in cell wall biosynthesis
VINGFPSPGNSIHSYNLAKILRASHEIDLICFRQESPYPAGRDYFRRVRQVALERRSVFAQGMASVLRNRPFCVLTHEAKAMEAVISAACREEAYSLVMFEPLAMGQYYSSVGACPKILFPVDATSRIKQQRVLEARSRGWKLVRHLDYSMVRRYEEWIYEKCEAVIFASSCDADFAVKHTPVVAGKAYTMPEGVDLEYFHPCDGMGDGGPIVAFLGDMGNYPNYHAVRWFLKEVWGRLKAARADAQLCIVGNDPGGRVADLCRADETITTTGFVDDVRPFIWQAAVFVSPLQTGTGMKNKILQAMAMGKAIVATPLSIEGTQIDPGEHLVMARDAGECLEGILCLLKDRETRVRMGRRARGFVEENHTLEAKAERFLNIAEEAVNRSGRR